MKIFKLFCCFLLSSGVVCAIVFLYCSLTSQGDEWHFRAGEADSSACHQNAPDSQLHGLAVGGLVGYDMKSASLMNSALVIFLDNVDKVNQVAESVYTCSLSG